MYVIATFTGLGMEGKFTHLLTYSLIWIWSIGKLIYALKLGSNTLSPASPTARFASVPIVLLLSSVQISGGGT